MDETCLLKLFINLRSLIFFIKSRNYRTCVNNEKSTLLFADETVMLPECYLSVTWVLPECYLGVKS